MAAALVVAVAAPGAQQAPPTREPASKAAAILTWPSEERERYIAALDSFFLTRTVKAGPHAHALERGRPLASFESGGPRADYVHGFMNAQRVRGVLVLQDGKIRLERYSAPHGPATRWNSFSVAKSITSTLVGAAMKDGYIRSLDDRRHALHQSLAWQRLRRRDRTPAADHDIRREVERGLHRPQLGRRADVCAALRARLRHDGELRAEAAARGAAGTKWVYKTSETNLVGVLVAEATGKPLADYLSEKIWRAYGMERDAEWMIDDVGHEQGGCCLAITLRDYGRFGQFILDGARVDGKPIVPDSWLAEATRMQVSTGPASGYGYQWWVRDQGTFEGRGIYGQTLHIDPARRLVVVINSAAEQPTGRGQGQARQDFIAAVKAEIDRERK